MKTNSLVNESMIKFVFDETDHFTSVCGMEITMVKEPAIKFTIKCPKCGWSEEGPYIVDIVGKEIGHLLDCKGEE